MSSNPKRIPGVAGRNYQPEMGDVIRLPRGHLGMVASNERPYGSQIDRRLVTVRYEPYSGSSPELHNELHDVADLVLVLPYDA